MHKALLPWKYKVWCGRGVWRSNSSSAFYQNFARFRVAAVFRSCLLGHSLGVVLI